MTTLFARRGYSGNYEPVGDDPTAANACGQQAYWDGSKCVPFSPGSTSSGHWYDPLVSLFGSASQAYTASQQAAAAQAAASQQNAWIMPVVLGGAALVAVAIVLRPRAPRTNPARRRRKRR